jgi:hypothetical protein
MYVYVGNTGKFHRNDPIGVDYYWDNDFRYKGIDVDGGRQLIADGVGSIREDLFDWLVEEYRADANAVTVDQVLGRAEASKRGRGRASSDTGPGVSSAARGQGWPQAIA